MERKKKGGGRGRPMNGEELPQFFLIKANFVGDEGAIKKEMLRKRRRRLRKALAREKETIPDQRKKPMKK